MKQAGERGKFREKVILARETVKDAFRRLMDGSGIGFGPELAFANANGSNLRASEFAGYHRKAPKNALFELSDSGGQQMTINHSELGSRNPYGRAFTALALVSKHDGWDPGPAYARESSLREALKKETDPRAATVILFSYAALAEDMGRDYERRILADILSLRTELMVAEFRRGDWRGEYGDFGEAVNTFLTILERLKTAGDLKQELSVLYPTVHKVMEGMHEAQKKVMMPLPGMAYSSFFMRIELDKMHGGTSCDSLPSKVPDTTEHGTLLDLKSEWGFIRAKAAVKAMETLEEAINGLINAARKEEQKGPLATIKAKGEFDAKASMFEGAARAILDALRIEKDPLAAEIMLRAYVYHVYGQEERGKLLRTLNSLNLNFGPRNDHFAGTQAAIDGYNRVLDQITIVLEQNDGEKLIRGFRAGLLQDARKALLALEKLHDVNLRATRELGQEPRSGL